MVLGYGCGTKVRFVGTVSGSGSRPWLKFVGTAPKTWVIIVGSACEVWVRFLSTGPGRRTGFVDTGSRTWLKFVCTASEPWVIPLTGVWARFEDAGIGTRLGFGSQVARLAEPVVMVKVLPPSGGGTETGLVGIVAASKVLVKLKGSRVLVAIGLSEVLAVGVDGPEVIFGAGLVLGPSSGPSVLIIWMEGSVTSTTFGLGCVLRLQVLTIGVHGAWSSCCFMGDVVPTGRATSVPGEDRD